MQIGRTPFAANELKYERTWEIWKWAQIHTQKLTGNELEMYMKQKYGN